jgi:hypothetical protein
MPVNALEGVVENGVIRLRDDVSLPEKTKVYVIVAEANAAQTPHIRTPRLAHPEQSKDFRKQVLEAPADANL